MSIFLALQVVKVASLLQAQQLKEIFHLVEQFFACWIPIKWFKGGVIRGTTEGKFYQLPPKKKKHTIMVL